MEFALADDTALDEAALHALDGVLAARRAGGAWTLEVSAAHETVPALLGMLARRGLTLTELRTHQPTLEDVFVSLTGRHLRDDA